MDFSQVVGFLVTMAAIVYMFVKRAQDLHKRSQAQDNDPHEEHHQHTLHDFLKSLDTDMEESEDFKPSSKDKFVKPEPLPVYHKKKHESKPSNKYDFTQEKFKSGLDGFQTKTNIDERKLNINIKNKYDHADGEHLLSSQFRGEKMPHLIGYRRSSRIKSLIRNIPSKKDLVLIHEVLDQPKGFKF